jgi:predicted dienelactone hydrolase
MELTAAPPLESPQNVVGHHSTLIVDTHRSDRMLGVEIWYPAVAPTERTTYDLIPGITFFSASAHEDAEVQPGRHPLVIWSHGRTGMRHNYSLLCEALAARGYIVIASDHPGDTLFDWALGTHVDDITNDRNRLGDVQLLIDSALGNGPEIVSWLESHVDETRIAVGGHSYGGLTALATVSTLHEFAPDVRVRAAVLAQGYTRILPEAMFATTASPVLMVVANNDKTTPPTTDADKAWGLLSARTDRVGALSRRVDIDQAGHQASSDFGLYAELAPQVENLPDMLRAYVKMVVDDSPPQWIHNWRTSVLRHVVLIDDFLNSV